METEIITLGVTQVSALLTLLMGVFALYFSYKAQSGLIDGEFKQTILKLSIFLSLVMISVAAMAVYHFNGSGLAEWIWFLVMFTALILSVYESKGNIAFGKSLLPLQKFASRASKSQRKRAKGKA